MTVKMPYHEVVEISSDSEDEDGGQDLTDSEEDGEEEEAQEEEEEEEEDGNAEASSDDLNINPLRTWKQKWGWFNLNLKWSYGTKSGWTSTCGVRELMQNWYGSKSLASLLPQSEFANLLLGETDSSGSPI